MKKSILLILSILFLTIKLLAQEKIESFNQKEVAYGISADIYSKYMFRGYNFSEGNVIQPSCWFSYNNFTISILSNLDLKNEHNRPECNEVDFVLNYIYSYKNFTLEPSFQFYYYPADDEIPITAETALKLSYSIKDFHVITSQYIDFLEYKGAYYTDVSIRYEHWFSDNSGLSTHLGLGWNNASFTDGYIGLNKSTFLSFFNISYTQYTHGGIYLKPMLEISNIFDKDVRECTGVKQPHFNLGLSMGIDF